MNTQVEKCLNIIGIESSFLNIVSFVATNILITEKQSIFLTIITRSCHFIYFHDKYDQYAENKTIKILICTNTLSKTKT